MGMETDVWGNAGIKIVCAAMILLSVFLSQICVGGGQEMKDAISQSGKGLTEEDSRMSNVYVKGHPRLYFTPRELEGLRSLHARGVNAKIWKNLQASADWCLTLTPRKDWIAPASPDPAYENLYDRFYAIMHDLAVTENLSFAYAISGDEKYGEAAARWTIASCRVWRREAEGAPDAGKAYAVTRMLKGVAVGYDLAHDRFSEEERSEIRRTLAEICGKYYSGYFMLPAKAGPEFHLHHASVECSSFGVVALALLGEVPEAQIWLDAMVSKFQNHLLPTGFTDDGAQIEGATFWASTMQYRIFFMDALRRITGRDLFTPYRKYMNADYALATIAARHYPGWNEPHQSVLMSPSYGQLDYYAPVLLSLAREYRRPIYQHLALWDDALGRIHKTRYITPTRGIQMLFDFGGYSYVWYDPTVEGARDERRLSYHFPSVEEGYIRSSWEAGDLLAGFAKGRTVIHAGGLPVLIIDDEPVGGTINALEDDGAAAVLRGVVGEGCRLTLELHRKEGRLIVRRQGSASPWKFWCHGNPEQEGNTLRWDKRATMKITSGSIRDLEPEGFQPDHAVGNGKLKLHDPFPKRYPLVIMEPDSEGNTTLEVSVSKQFQPSGEQAIEERSR
jgi:hypothetical protein